MKRKAIEWEIIFATQIINQDPVFRIRKNSSISKRKDHREQLQKWANLTSEKRLSK